MTRPPWAATRTKDSCTNKCATTSAMPSSFRIKGVSILTLEKWLFGALVHHPLGLLAFQIKLLFLVPTAYQSISCPAAEL